MDEQAEENRCHLEETSKKLRSPEVAGCCLRTSDPCSVLSGLFLGVLHSSIVQTYPPIRVSRLLHPIFIQ